MKRRLGALTTFLAVSALPVTTLASESDAEGASIALLAGYGESTSVNVLGFGAGFRTGYRLDVGLYLGALALAHLGTSDDWEPEVRHHAQSARGEIGYEFRVQKLALRPTLRAGAALVTTSRDMNDGFVSPQIGLGLTLLLELDHWLVGVDGDSHFLTRPVEQFDNSSSIAGLAVYLSGGYQF